MSKMWIMAKNLMKGGMKEKKEGYDSYEDDKKETIEERGRSRLWNQRNLEIMGDMNLYHEAKWGGEPWGPWVRSGIF